MEMREIAESIVAGLNNLDTKSKAIDKIAHSYTSQQVEIVLNHLRQLRPAKQNIYLNHYRKGVENEDADH